MSNNNESAKVMSLQGAKQGKLIELSGDEISKQAVAQEDKREATDAKAASPGKPEDVSRRIGRYAVPAVAAAIGLSVATNLGVFGNPNSKKGANRVAPEGTPAGVVADWSSPSALSKGAQAQFKVEKGEGPAQTAERVVPNLDSSTELRHNVIARLKQEDANPHPGDFEHLPQFIVSTRNGGQQPPKGNYEPINQPSQDVNAAEPRANTYPVEPPTDFNK